jgi:hypothetical protein
MTLQPNQRGKQKKKKKKLAQSSGVMKRDQSANRIPQSSIEIVVNTERKERRETENHQIVLSLM